jgi:chromosome segregation protein
VDKGLARGDNPSPLGKIDAIIENTNKRALRRNHREANVQLTKLRLSGFKSFVEPTELVLEPGLTGIVGPNGCGKSNLVDALKWVMGETSAKQLRGGEMDDVIFGGTQTRPARNFAEVVLHLDNSFRKAPAAFNDNDQIEVTRRIDRGEGSSYKINARDTRQRDVQTLFADASTGAHSTAIVSQGRVGHLVNAKPQERRALLEEAAGITGLHARRHEAELRLNAAENNIKRGEDGLRQLAEQLHNLQKQAKQANAYRSLAERFRSTEALWFHHQFADLANRLQTADQTQAELTNQLQQLDQDLHQLGTQQAELAANIPQLRQHEAERAAALQRLNLDEHELGGEESRLASAMMAVEQKLAQIALDLEREESLRRDAEQNAAQIDQEKGELLRAQEGVAEVLGQLEERNIRQNGLLTQAEELLVKLQDQLNTEEKQWSMLQERHRQLQARVERLTVTRDDLTARTAQLAAVLNSDDSLQLSLEGVVFAEAGLQNAQKQSELAEAQLLDTQQKFDTAQTIAQKTQMHKGELQAEQKGLQAILRQMPDVHDPMMGKIRVQPGYEAALAAALGDELFASALDTADRYWAELPELRDLPALPGGAEPLSKFVDAPKAMRRALDLVGVMADPNAAPPAQAALHLGQCLVTTTGDLWRFDGYTARASATQNTTAFLQQKNRLQAVEAELNALLPDEALALGTQAQAAQELAQAKQRQAQTRQELDTAYKTLQAAQTKHAHANQKLAGISAEHQSITAQLTQTNAELAELQPQLTAVDAERATQPDFAELRQCLSDQRAEVESLRHQAYAAKAEWQQTQRDTAAREARYHALLAQAQDWQKRLETIEARQQQLTERNLGALTEQQELAKRPEELATRRNALLAQITTAQAARTEAADILAQAEQVLTQVDKQFKQLEQQAASHRIDQARAQTTLELGTVEREKLQFDLTERLGCGADELLAIAGFMADDPLPEFSVTQNKLERLRRERDNMGPVNLRADVEAQEVEAKLTAQQAEHDQLLAATEKLRRAIGELNAEGRARLTEAFVKVNENFSRLFTELFGGGKAYLEWTEHDDPLQAGLEIFASPPGKKLQSLSLLSGGERALTAIALLFAVFECNPAPICVLDEVDAPLDESNVDRYCNMLEVMAKRGDTRYVVITHHRLTMARMHRLFGVTMGEPGVSQLVSVDLQQAERMKATA